MRLVTTDAITVCGLRDVAGPATFGQRYMWDIIQSLEPNAEHLNSFILAEMTSHLSVDKGVSVLRELWSRHESFRTSFTSDRSGTLLQEIRSRVDFAVTIWRAEPGDSEADVRTALADFFTKRFDVTEHAQARGAVVTVGGRVQWLATAMCHMVTDGWSNILLRRDLRDLAAGRASRAVDLVHPFDHASFELSDRSRRANDAAIDYWIRTLHKFPARYPGEGARSPETPRYRDVVLTSPTVGAAAQAAATRLGSSPNAVVATVFAELVSNLTGLTEVPFLVRTASRNRPELLQSVGAYAQAAPVVVRTAPRAPGAVFQSLLTAERRGPFNPQHLSARIMQTWPDPLSRPSRMITINPIPSPVSILGEPEQDLTANPTHPHGLRVSVGFGHDDEKVAIYCNAALSRGYLALFVDTTFLSSGGAADNLREVHAKLHSLAT